MSERDNLGQSGTITIGEDLYGLSINELSERVSLFEAEILRVKAEMEKKKQERSAAESVFGSKS